MNRRNGARAMLSLVLGALAFGSAPAFAQLLPDIPKLPTIVPPPSPVETLTNVPPSAGPLPGSIADEHDLELRAREDFTAITAEGNRYRFLPHTLLWEPALAVKRDPRMQFLASNLKNYRGDNTLDTTIGGTVGLFRFEFPGRDAAVQLDLFGVVLSRLSPDDLMADDYRFGLPLTWRRGWWSGKIGYEHTSAHIGDEQAYSRKLIPQSISKDELVGGLSRILYEQFRLYGHAAYALGFQNIYVENTTPHRLRADLGAEWYDRKPTGFWGTPFAAGNVEWRGDQDFETNLTLQTGWLWKNPFQRNGMARVFVEYYRGRSPYGQFIRDRESFVAFGFGLGFDY